jgi:uncharacterized protein (DUF58 family)
VKFRRNTLTFSDQLDRRVGFYLGDGFLMSRVRSVLRDRLTPSGRVVFGLALLANLVGGVSFALKTYFVTCGLVGLLLASVAAARWARTRLGLAWDVPSRVTRGVPFMFHFTLHNPGKRWARDVGVAPRLPHWALLDEPGGFFPWIGPGQEVRGHLNVTFPRRGHYLVAGVRLSTIFPFGLWRDWFEHPRPRPVLVYPDFQPLLRLDIPVGRRYQPGGIALTSNLGDSTEFLATREFRAGDSLRMIHWRSWARLGQPVVKEFQEEFFCRIALVMDTFLKPSEVGSRRDEFEAAITLAAALADNLAREEYVIDLFAAGPELYQLQAGRSLAHFENVMDILACVEPCLEPPFEKLEPVLLDCLENVTTAVVLLLDWDERRERLIESIRERGCAIKVVLVTDSRPPTSLRPDELVCLTREQIEQGVEQL